MQMAIIFREASSYEDHLIWLGTKGAFTFVISKDITSGKYTASAKDIDALPFDDVRIDLGGHNAHHSM